ncbi:MAG: UDP-N-acetylmuramoyl-L-alanine--D-glutamate ligase, partial [Kiritimatiellae bacterium]|nr:UDP-N-acetylmuramoyl-L-alanine--D-glutamate ligase [Kiritimatiellia bacterium]
SPEAAAARAAGLRLCGELDLGAALWRGRLVAVTGSKGKSSLVKLLADALRAAGLSAEPCGNYGTPLCALADAEEPPDFAVCECSSFQLEWARGSLAPEVAILLNVSQDHLDRHGTMEAYRDAKLSLFAGQGRGGVALLPASGSAGSLARYAELFPDRPAPQTFGAEPEADWRWTRGGVQHPATGRAGRVAGSYFDNEVLGPAAAAAVAALDALGLTREQIEAAFRAFEPLPHRMRTVAVRDGVAWIDNSKATSLAALEASVRMAPRPVLLVAGGRLKEPLSLRGETLAALGVAKVYAVGECGAAMARAWGAALPAEDCGDLERACAAAARDAAALRPGCVLLAPGTASFDQFRSFEERGDRFAALARSARDARDGTAVARIPS